MDVDIVCHFLILFLSFGSGGTLIRPSLDYIYIIPYKKRFVKGFLKFFSFFENFFTARLFRNILHSHHSRLF
jgi:hypothetical protein